MDHGARETCQVRAPPINVLGLNATHANSGCDVTDLVDDSMQIENDLMIHPRDAAAACGHVWHSAGWTSSGHRRCPDSFSIISDIRRARATCDHGNLSSIRLGWLLALSSLPPAGASKIA